MAEKTHWKKIVSDPNFIGEADIEVEADGVFEIEDFQIRQMTLKL